MILTELEMHNFGVYAGIHRIPLDPPDTGQPIVLFGGLNGAGKTTILEAVQLVLFGKRAQISKREGLSYEDYLQRCIHHSVPESEGAGVRLRFRLRTQGDIRSIQINRTWRRTRSGIREVHEAYMGAHGEERFHDFLTDHWAEYIDEVVPLGIAPLFFFDADRIEGFSDLSNSAELIRTAVHGLLGLDLVDRLMLDLEILEGRKVSKMNNDAYGEALGDAGEVVFKVEQNLADARERVSSIEVRLDEIVMRLEKVENRFRKEGGELYVERASLETELRHIVDTISATEDELRTLAAGEAPLLLVVPLLLGIQDRDMNDQERELSIALDSSLEERDEEFMRFLSSYPRVSKTLVGRVQAYLESDRSTRVDKGDILSIFNLSREGHHHLKVCLQEQTLESTRQAIEKLLTSLDNLADRRNDIERKLQGVPGEEVIRSLLRERGELHSKKAEMERNLLRAREEQDRLSRELDAARRQQAAVQKKAASEKWADEAARRVVHFSMRSRGQLGEFRERILERNIRRIERMILESFQQLLRKRGLVHDIEIDPQTLSLRLYGDAGQTLHSDRLSAGERQLLAVSLLWGLARASHRMLPMIVDTPLGRLDSIHREHLVQRYFPYASHQVLLLSTDEEINEAHLERLSDHIGRSYHLHYNEKAGGTSISEGYFVQGEAA